MTIVPGRRSVRILARFAPEVRAGIRIKHNGTWSEGPPEFQTPQWSVGALESSSSNDLKKYYNRGVPD